MAKPKNKKKPGQDRREERKTLLNELRANTSGRSIQGYAEYVAKMEALDKLMDKYSRKNVFGARKTMDAEARSDILKAMQETAEAGEAYLQKAMEAKKTGTVADLKKGAPGLVNQLQGTLIRDQEALEAYDPAKAPLSLTQVLENSRSTVVRLGGVVIAGEGGAQNSRLPITFRDRSGKLRRGMFTKETRAKSLDASVNQLLERAAGEAETEEGKDAVRNIVRTYRSRNSERLANASDTQVFHELYTKYTKKMLNVYTEEVDIEVTADSLGKALGVDLYNELGEEGVTSLGMSFKDYGAYIDDEGNIGQYVNSSILGMEQEERIDSRNSAMSSVARLLGQPGLIAGAENMQFVNDKGEVVEGTFMDEADGVDLAQGGRMMKAVNDRPFEGKNSHKCLRKMADLQVLDYICGNVDRHVGNMLYKTDGEGNIVGIQGIDNDSSFGRFVGKGPETHKLPLPADMNVISASMSKKVMKLTPAMLKYSLRGRGLSEEELDYAAKRLTELQSAIRTGREYYQTHPTKAAFEKGYLRTVEDKDFEKLKLSELCLEGQQNGFRELAALQSEMIDHYKQNPDYAFDPHEKRKELALREVGTVGYGFTGGNLSDALQGASRLAEDKETNFSIDSLTRAFRGSSPEFDAMAEAAKKLAGKERELLAGPIHPSSYNRRLKEIDAMVGELRTSNDEYLQKKMRERGVDDLTQLRGKNDYEQARIDHAMRIHDFCRDYISPQPLTPEVLDQMNDMDREELRFSGELEEMKDRDEAYRLLAEFHRKQGMDTPENVRAKNREEAGLPPEEQKDAENEAAGAAL